MNLPSSARCRLSVSLLSLAFQAGATSALWAAEDAWPQFRGSNASGVAADRANPPIKIGPESSVLWKTEVPWSPSSPVVWGAKLFLTTSEGDLLQTRAYDRGSGRLLWTAQVKAPALEEFHRTDGSPAASTPATDGRHVVSYFGSFGLICYNMGGEELWRYPMPTAESAGKFGTGTSPVIVGQKVLLSRDDPAESKLSAFDVKTGKVLWDAPRADLYGSFGTPVHWRNDGVEEVVLPGSLMLKGYSLESGEERWSIGGLCPFSCTTPVSGGGKLYYAAWAPGAAENPWPDWSDFHPQHDTDADGIIALSEVEENRRDFMRALDVNGDGNITASDWKSLRSRSSRGTNQLIAVEQGGRGDITGSHVAWVHKKGLPYVPSPLFYEGRIYIVKDGGLVSSLDAATGRVVYNQERLKARGSYYASPVATGGKLYVASLQGKLTVIKAGGKAPEILHETDFGERIFATPAIVGDRLYLRTQTMLYAFGSTSG